MKIHRSLIVAITITVLVFSALFPVPAYAEGEPPADPISPGLAPTDFPVSVDSGASTSDSTESNSETTSDSVPDSTESNQEATSDSAPNAAEAEPPTETQPSADSVPTGLLPTDFPVSVDSIGDGSTGDETETSKEAKPAADSAPTGLLPTDFPVPVQSTGDGSIGDRTETFTEAKPAAEAQPAADSVPTGLLPTDFPVTFDSATESAPQVESVPEILASIPPETKLALADANGDLQSLGSEAGSQILVNGDPQWCPGNTPSGDPSCVGPYSSFDLLIANLGSKTGAGTIYVAYNYDASVESGTNIVFDSSTAPTLAGLTDLTIQGGWDFSTNLKHASDSVSTIDGHGLIIGDIATPWNGSVTLKDIVIQNAPARGISADANGDIVFENVTVDTSSRSGIYAIAAGNITATDVTVTGVDVGSGNNYGAALFSGGSVDIQRSSFDNNNGFGLLVWVDPTAPASTSVSLNQVSASGNLYDGLTVHTLVNSHGPISVQDSVFSGNKGSGVYLDTFGSVNINDTFVDDNSHTGLEINGKNDITLNNISASRNGNYGVRFYQDQPSFGNITLNNVQAIGNQGSGAYLIVDNGTVSINGGNFNDNTEDGFYVSAFSGSGQVAVTNVTASGNGLDGGALESFGGSGATSPLTVSNSTFISNGWDGLYVRAGGTVTLNQVTSVGNGGSGAYIDAALNGIYDDKWISVDNSTLTGNGEYGVDADPDSLAPPGLGLGILYLNNVTLTGNGFGCYFLINGSVVETNVLCAVVAADTGTGTGSSGDQAGRTRKKHLPQTGGYNPGSQELSINEVSATSGTAVALDCQNFSGTSFNLPGGADAILGCSFGDKGMITQMVKDKLPGEMPARFTFIQSLGVDVMLGGVTFPPMAINGQISVQFPLPAGSDGKNLAIMFWDPSLNAGAGGWVELPARVLNPDGTDKTFPLRTPPDGLTILTGVYQENGLITVVTNFPGVFMLVAK